MAKKYNILLKLNHSIAFDRRAFDGIATLANERGDVRLVERRSNTPWANTVRQSQIDGVIIARLWDDERAGLDETGVPFVVVADRTIVSPNERIVAMDEQAIGQMAARHFIDAGYQHFVVFGLPNLLGRLSGRVAGFVDEVKAAGHTCSSGPTPADDADAAGDPEEETYWAAEAETWFRDLPKPLAVFAPYDYQARVAVTTAQAAGLRVPDDVAVLGVDDDDLYCMTTSPQLSSVITPGRQVGETALNALLAVLRGDQNVPDRTLIAPPGVMVRGSSSDFALQDQDVIAAVRFIRENAARGVTVSQIAEHVALSRRTLERRFLATLSCTIRDEIRQAKVNRAKRLLIDTDLSYTEVARKSGLNHQQQLSRMIKVATGSTPAQFRQAARAYRKP